MNSEPETTERNQSTQTQEGNGGRNQSETSSLFDSADIKAKRLEAANEKAEILARRIEEFEARQRLGGKTSGVPQQAKPETDAEYAQRALRGLIPTRK